MVEQDVAELTLLTAMLCGLLFGFAFGYAVRSWISARHRAASYRTCFDVSARRSADHSP